MHAKYLLQVSNKNLCSVGETLGLPGGAIRSLKLDMDCWRPPGYSVKGEEMLIRTESKLVSEHGWSVGDAVKWITSEEMDRLEVGDEEKLMELLLARKNSKTEVVGVRRLREYRLMSDKSCADCVEALIGSQLLHGGPQFGM